jgi:TolA-binding protein
MTEDLTELDAATVNARVADLRERMRPLQQDLDRLRSERDVLLTELRRRERQESMRARADFKSAMREGSFPSVADLVASVTEGGLDDFVYNLKTGGEVVLGFPGARRPTLAFTDGRQVAQVSDLAEAARYYAAGWELGSPGRPGVRVHFSGSRQERLIDAAEIFARPREN